MNYAIVTGATRGLGESIATLFIERGVSIINVSRRDNEQLKALAEQHQVSYSFFQCELAESKQTEWVFRKVAKEVCSVSPDNIYFVQNAGVVSPIGPSGSLEAGQLETSVHVNLLAPMIAANEVIKAVKETESNLIMVNVSSGAGKRAVFGWSAYSTTKAGINMFTEALAFEFKQSNLDYKVIAYSPGVMDTDMQGEIRSSSKESFQEVETFQRYKEEGMLRDTNVVAKALLDLIFAGEIENGKIYHVNNLL